MMGFSTALDPNVHAAGWLHATLGSANPAVLLGSARGNALGLTPSTESRHYPPRRVATFTWDTASSGDLPYYKYTSNVKQRLLTDRHNPKHDSSCVDIKQCGRLIASHRHFGCFIISCSKYNHNVAGRGPMACSISS